MFDMTQCKIGDKLVNRRGEVRELSCINNDDGSYRYKDTENLSYTDWGEWWSCETNDEDIVGFAGQRTDNTPCQLQPINHLPPISIRKEERFFITINDTEVEITPEELYNLQHQINELVGEE